MHRCRYLTNFGQSANLYSRTIIGRGDAGDQQHVKAIDYANENPPDRHCLHFVGRAVDYPIHCFCNDIGRCIEGGAFQQPVAVRKSK